MSARWDWQLWGCRDVTLLKPYSVLTADLLLCLQAEDLAVIELDIGQAPTFKHELPPQARRHTLWSTCDDFTAGAMTATRSATESLTNCCTVVACNLFLLLSLSSGFVCSALAALCRTLRLVCEPGMLDGPMESLLSCDERLAELTASSGLPTAAGPLPADAANSPLATAEGENASSVRSHTHDLRL